MDGFIDRLAEILRELFGPAERGSDARPRGARPDAGEPAGEPERRARGRGGFADPDLADAWEELDDFLSRGRGNGRNPQGNRAERPPHDRRPIDEALRQDYANLEVPFGADIEEVKRSYKTLMLRYHPDKHSGDPERQRIALEITKKINESFERIKKGSR